MHRTKGGQARAHGAGSGGGGPAHGSPGKRCYAIGDVHGRLDLLDALLALIEADNAKRAPKETALVMLGDLIDRGPDSFGVVERLLRTPPRFSACYFIKGNHEEALLRALSGESGVLQKWLASGGYECAQSYGAPMGTLFGATDAAILDVLRAQIPQSHVDFLQGFADSIRFGDYLLVHAGVRPGTPLERQGRDLRWIRDEFLTSDADFGWIVVHGHTITELPEVRWNRIGIDTGAYRTGRLTAVRLEENECEIIAVRGAPASSQASG